MKMETLIIDDDSVMCYLHKRICGKVNAGTVNTFCEPQKAIEFLRKSDSEDRRRLILLDINMPEMSGWDVLNILDTLPFKTSLYIVLVTSSIDKVDIEKAKDYPLVRKFVSKPLRQTKLEELCQAAVIYWGKDVSRAS